MIPAITRQIKLRNKMGECTAWLSVHNFDAVLVVIVISAGGAIFAKFHTKLLKRVKLHISRYVVHCFTQEAVFLMSVADSEGPVPGPGPGPIWAHTGVGDLGVAH